MTLTDEELLECAVQGELTSELFDAEVLKAKRKEGLYLDYKADAYQSSGKLSEFRKDVSAFMNAEGGILFLGVLDKNARPNEIVGIQDADEQIDRLMKGMLALKHASTTIVDKLATPSGDVVYVAVEKAPKMVPVKIKDRLVFYARFDESSEPLPDWLVYEMLGRSRRVPQLDVYLNGMNVKVDNVGLETVQKMRAWICTSAVVGGDTPFLATQALKRHLFQTKEAKFSEHRNRSPQDPGVRDLEAFESTMFPIGGTTDPQSRRDGSHQVVLVLTGENFSPVLFPFTVEVDVTGKITNLSLPSEGGARISGRLYAGPHRLLEAYKFLYKHGSIEKWEIATCESAWDFTRNDIGESLVLTQNTEGMMLARAESTFKLYRKGEAGTIELVDEASSEEELWGMIDVIRS